MSKLHAEQMADGQWKILNTKNDGTEETKDTVAEIEGMDDATAIQVFQGLVAQAPNKRKAAVSLMVNILRFSRDAFEPMKGTGDKTKGQIPLSLGEEFRAAEKRYFDQFMKTDHALHRSFISRLPKMTERGDDILNQQGEADNAERYAYFLTSLRKDPSYAQAKNLFLNFWSFVGGEPYHEDKKGIHILPPEVMRVMVANAKNVTPPDNSWAGQYDRILREMILAMNSDKPISVDPARLADLIQNTNIVLGELERLQKLSQAAEAKRAKPGDVVTQTQEAMAKANAKRTGEPSAAAKKATTHH